VACYGAASYCVSSISLRLPLATGWRLRYVALRFALMWPLHHSSSLLCSIDCNRAREHDSSSVLSYGSAPSPTHHLYSPSLSPLQAIRLIQLPRGESVRCQVAATAMPPKAKKSKVMKAAKNSKVMKAAKNSKALKAVNVVINLKLGAFS
jgi:hypothetical protein